MGYTIIAPVGDNTKALFVGMKKFPTEKVILITPEDRVKEANTLKKKLDEFTIKSNIIEVQGNMMEQMFKTFGNICAVENNDCLIVNVATGDRLSTCAALSAAFANGLKAIGVMDDQVMMLPILKLSYYNELSENKLNILQHMSVDEKISLKALAEKLNMSISLLSYHINGNFKYKGLKEYGLVDVQEEGKNILVKLSEMGNLLLQGYVKQKKKE
jgi:DNA-binding transcriptional ArsR family regulator